MTFGFVLAMYSSNLFVLLTAPFVYMILENFTLAVLGGGGVSVRHRL